MPIPSIQTNHFLCRRSSEDARQYVYRVIKYCILELLLFPGQQLKEVDLAQSLSVSRTPVHDTIFKLSREHLADIFPNRGAFVSKLSPESIRNAIWTHEQMGLAILQDIHIHNVPKSKLDSLLIHLNYMEGILERHNPSEYTRGLMEFYHLMYTLLGDKELVWKSLQNVDTDLRRLTYLAASSSVVSAAFIHELHDLSQALIQRDNDKACRIYTHHLSRMLLLIDPLHQHNPQYFVADQEGVRLPDQKERL